MARTKTMSVNHQKAGLLKQYPSFSSTGSISGMKRQVYGKDALLVRCGSYIYNVDQHLYDLAH